MKRIDSLSMLGLTFLLSPIGAFAQLAPADQGTINHRDSNALARREAARPVRLTVSPKGQSPIAMTTLPNAVCSLHPDGDTTRSIQLFADEEGVVHFYAGGSAEDNFANAFALDCEADGVAQTFPVELRANSVPTMDMPAPAREVRKLRPGSFVQPALTEFEAAALSDQDLAARGYPIRPDPKDARGHASWLKAVTQPMTVVPSTTAVANPAISHPLECCNTSTISKNWSGYQLQSPADKSFSYGFVTGTWRVPEVIGSNNGPMAHSSFLIGLDGTNTSDMVEAGTEQDAITTNGMTIGASYAWFQFLPRDKSEVFVPQMLVGSGDEVICEVWIGPQDPNQPPSLSGSFAQFAIFNVTKQLVTVVSESRATAGLPGQRLVLTAVPGRQVEWIVERPLVNGKLTDLADYDLRNGFEIAQAEMFGCLARLDVAGVPGAFVSANQSLTLPLSMYNGGRTAVTPLGPLLSAPRAGGNPANILFDWFSFH